MSESTNNPAIGAGESEGDRNPIDLLAEEFAERCRQGSAPSVEDYAARYPQWADDIRALFPPVAAMEALKRKHAPRATDVAALLATPDPGNSATSIHRDVANAPTAIRVGPPLGLKPSPKLENLGDFKILREIGRGGMGIVYDAQQITLGRRVALKVLPRHSLLDATRLQRFQREAQAAARLHHTNIVSVFGSGESDGLHYYVMQLIEGNPLNEILHSLRNKDESISKLMPAANSAEYWRWAAKIGIQVAEALDYAHKQGTLHRDIKPGNILLDQSGNAWITDFGLAKIAAGEDLTETGDLIGTLQYMAPETFDGPASPQSDIYSLGLLLFELLTLRLPFERVSAPSMIRQRAEREPLAPRAANPAIPRDLETIVLKAIARLPQARYGNGSELADDLRRFIDDRPVLARPVGNIERLARWRRRNRAIAALSAAAVLSLLLALAAGWIGYVKTNDALSRESQRRADADAATSRAEENVKISLHAFEKIFDLLDAANPGADRRPPPPNFDGGGPENGRRPNGPPEGRPDERPFGPPPDGFQPDPGPDGPRGPRPRPDRQPDGPDRPDRPRGPRPDQGPPDQDRKPNVDLFQSVLSFYDEFAEKNETNATLQFEAAKAYGRVGELQLRVNKLDEAEKALRRAMPTAEKLHAEFPEDREYTGLIARTAEQLGLLLQRRQKPAEAEAYFQQAAKLELALIQQAPGDEHCLVDLARTRQAFSEFLKQQGRFDAARKTAEATIAELKPHLSEMPRLQPWLGMQYGCLAAALKGLGDSDGAARAIKEAEALRNLPKPAPPPRP